MKFFEPICMRKVAHEINMKKVMNKHNLSHHLNWQTLSVSFCFSSLVF